MTAKSLYALLIRLHPREFRETYGEEMLWVFEQDSMERPPHWLLWDGVRSLVRQRLFRPAGSTTPAVALNGPSFLVLEEARVRPLQLLRGVAAAAVLYGLVLGPAVDTGYVSGTLRIPTIYTYQKSGPGAYQIEDQRLREAEARESGTGFREAERPLVLGPERAGKAPNSTEAGVEADRNPTVYRIPSGTGTGLVLDARLLELLDINGDGWIDREEQAADAARYWTPVFRVVPADERGRIAVEDLKLILPVNTVR